MRNLFIFVLGACWASIASAAPQVDSVQGTFEQGQELTISGSGFGAKAQAAPLIFDTVDEVWINGTRSDPYSNLSNGDTIPVGPGMPWRSQNVSDIVKLAKSDNYGNRSSHYRGVIGPNAYGDAQDAWLEDPNGFPHPDTGEVREVYLRWYFRPSFDPANQQGSHKFVRIRNSLGNDHTWGISWTQMHLSSRGADSSWAGWGGEVGRWNLMEMYIDADAETLKAWVNGSLRHDVTGIGDIGARGIQPRLWGLDGSGDADFGGEVVELADYYADKTRARVEICNSGQWADCKVREPQIPVDWSNHQIRIQANRGALDANGNTYLYVIHADGSVNASGYPVTGGPAPKAPKLSIE